MLIRKITVTIFALTLAGPSLACDIKCMQKAGRQITKGIKLGCAQEASKTLDALEAGTFTGENKALSLCIERSSLKDKQAKLIAKLRLQIAGGESK